MKGHYETKDNAAGKPMFNLKATNGQVILTSEAYESAAGRDNGISSCQTNSQNDDMYEDRTSTGGDPYFVLKAANGKVIGRSEMYSSTAAKDKGKASVKANGNTTDIR